MRGSLPRSCALEDKHGIIPAHAGLTRCGYCSLMSRWDHPRACGAHADGIGRYYDDQGSSPRMRGSPCTEPTRLSICGIIPAHAGLTYLFRGKIICPGDHPRACGAHNYAGVFCTGYMGSSPRMRGSLPPRCILPSPRGIIPAHAGLTRRGPSSAAGRKDHPRACGAHPFFDPELPLDLGSSPRMRGSLTAMRTPLMQPGIIPAHAGLTIGVEAAWLVWRDHPRACGAHFENPSQMCYNRGSSPRMRGSPGRQVSVQEFTGIIPAHAGLTMP